MVQRPRGRAHPFVDLVIPNQPSFCLLHAWLLARRARPSRVPEPRDVIVKITLLPLLFLCLLFGAPPASAASCASPYSLNYSGPTICWYYGAATVTSGPTDCKLPGGMKSEGTATCQSPGASTNLCVLDLSEKITTKYNLSGSIAADGFGLSAAYETETVTEAKCSINDPISVDCTKCVKPLDATCCKEAFEVQRTVTKRRDVIQCSNSDFDTFQCNFLTPTCTSTTVACTEEGTLKTLLRRNCGDCQTMTDCQ